MKKYFAEGLGTFLFVFFGCIASAFAYGKIGVFGVALCFGLSYMLVYMLLRNISESHINPLVSFSAYLQKKIKFNEFIKYTVAQLLGSLVAGLAILVIVLLCTDAVSVIQSRRIACGFGADSMLYIPPVLAFILEGMLVFGFIYLYNFANNQVEDKYKSFIVALGYMIVVIFAFNFTGSCANIAKTFGAAFVYVLTGNLMYVVYFLVFAVASFLATFLANKLYNKNFK